MVIRKYKNYKNYHILFLLIRPKILYSGSIPSPHKKALTDQTVELDARSYTYQNCYITERALIPRNPHVRAPKKGARLSKSGRQMKPPFFLLLQSNACLLCLLLFLLSFQLLRKSSSSIHVCFESDSSADGRLLLLTHETGVA